MNQARQWTIGAVLLIVVLLVGTWFLGVAPRLGDARDADAALEQAVTLNNLHRQTLANLQVEHDRIDQIRDELAEAHSVIPEGPEGADVLRTLDRLAVASGVAITNLTFNTMALYTPPDDAPAEYLATANELAGAGLYVIPMSIEVTGSSTALLRFVSEVQTTQRYFHVYNGEMLNEEGVGILTIHAELFGLSSLLAERDEAASIEPADS